MVRATSTMRCAAFLLICALAFRAGMASAGEYPPPEPARPAKAAAAKTHHHAKRVAPYLAPAKVATPLLKPANRPDIAKAESAPADPPKTRASPAPLPKPALRPKLALAEPATGKMPPLEAAASVAAVRLPAPSSAGLAIPSGERLKLQSALLWSGDYSGVAAGEDPMVAAVKNYQKRVKAKVTGALTPAERANLIAADRHHEQRFGWNVVVDPATGIRIGVPSKLVPQAREAARGTRWSSAHGEVQVETFRIREPGLTLAALFEREKREPSSRQIESSALRDDGFVISGFQGLKKFYVRAKIRDGEARGFTLLFDQAMETIVEPVMTAMASSFSPFPERSAPFAALAKSVEYGSGVVVSARGHIVTDRRLTQGCGVIVAAGNDADLVADDPDSGLALLRVYGPRKLPALSLSQAPGDRSGELSLIGMPAPKQQDGARTLAEIKGWLTDGNAIEPRQPVPMAGFSGAAALDAQGRFLGLMQMRNFVLASAEPAAPPVRLVNAAAIRAFLTAHEVAPAAAATADAKASVVRIICVRN